MDQATRLMVILLGIIIAFSYIYLLGSWSSGDGDKIEDQVAQLRRFVSDHTITGIISVFMGGRILIVLGFVFSAWVMLNGSIWAYVPLILIVTDVSFTVKKIYNFIAYMNERRTSSGKNSKLSFTFHLISLIIVSATLGAIIMS